MVRPDGFDLSEAWASITADVAKLQAPVRARAMATTDSLGVLRWVFGNRLTIGPPDGTGRVEIEVRSSSEVSLAGEIAGLGAKVEVIEPDAIRRRLADIASELGALYGASPARAD